ncbi:hypothetical protein K2173_001746 [Erythroxylum novogranatense]|uniref:Uncharacterized protein n=1 Tax=Erythroxylum novogranatense TaxID=1862640 RepID=A0AAV8S810_9ROSI|nr:hypothetical protein K2173_001746 [Erythroxylum novogranatense]
MFALWLSSGGLPWARACPKALSTIPGLFNFSSARFLDVFTRATTMICFEHYLFCYRPVKKSAYELLFHRAMGFGPYNEYCRHNWRRISSTHSFNPMRIGAFEPFRREMGIKIAEEVNDSMSKVGQFEVRKLLHFDLWTIDHLPVLSLLDLQGVRERGKKLVSMPSDSDMIVLWMVFNDIDTIAILLEWVLARMETPRVHPLGHLLSWSFLAINDVHLGGIFIPTGTIAMVNMWAITQDKEELVEPEKFKPERFMDADFPNKVYPNKALGLATWVSCDQCDVDLSECLKLSMEMKKPLVCRAVLRTA